MLVKHPKRICASLPAFQLAINRGARGENGQEFRMDRTNFSPFPKWVGIDPMDIETWEHQVQPSQSKKT
jgi:hypothetical protein